MRPPTSDDHNFFVRTPFRVFLDSMVSPLSQDSSHVPMEGSGGWGFPDRAGRLGLDSHVRPPTLDGHNFFVRTPFWVFLDSMKSPLSEDFSHLPVVTDLVLSLSSHAALRQLTLWMLLSQPPTYLAC